MSRKAGFENVPVHRVIVYDKNASGSCHDFTLGSTPLLQVRLDLG